MSYERVYKGGTHLHAMVILADPTATPKKVAVYLRHETYRVQNEIRRSNGTVEVIVVPAPNSADHFDSSDNTYYCRVVEQGPSFDDYVWISFDHLVPLVAPSKLSDGMTCFECKNGYPMAEPNFEDKLVCWSCCDSLGWKYSKDKKTGKVTAK